MATFDKAKVGDKVWSNKKGWTEIILIDLSKTYPIETKEGDTFTMDGFRFGYDLLPSLFWDVPFLTIPPKPKRIVKKEMVKYANINPHELFTIHNTKEIADCCARHDRIACVPVTIDWEEEE